MASCIKKKLRFTFPSTTQQSLIMYRLGALSVASTMISYLTKFSVMEIFGIHLIKNIYPKGYVVIVRVKWKKDKNDRKTGPLAERKTKLLITRILAENFQSIGSPQSFLMFHNLNSGVDPDIQNPLVPRTVIQLLQTIERNFTWGFSFSFSMKIDVKNGRRKSNIRATSRSSRFHFWLTNICFRVDNLKYSMNE